MRTAHESVHLVAATIGFVSFGALWAGTLWGTVLRSGWAASRLRHHTVHGAHMHLVLLGLWLGIVHALTQLASPDGKVRPIDVVIPFLDRADPVGVGLGVVALELLLASALSVLVQRRLGFHRWRALHSLGYLAFTLVAAHLLVSGSEVTAAPVRAAVALAWAAVAVAGASTIAPVARLPRALLERLARRHRAEEITVAVDAGRCGSFGFCEQEAPAIFSLRSDQRLAYRSVAPADQAEAAMRAAVVCPARAITLGRLPTAVVVAQPPAAAADDEPVPVGLAAQLGGAIRPAGGRGAGRAGIRTGTGTGVGGGGTGRTGAGNRAAGRAGTRAGTGLGVETGAGLGVGTGIGVGTGVGVGTRVGGRGAGRAGEPAAARAGTGPPLAPPPAGRPVAGPQLVSSVHPRFRPDAAAVPRPGPDRSPAVDPLPPPSELQDTGRHHLPALRGLPGGRS